MKWKSVALVREPVVLALIWATPLLVCACAHKESGLRKAPESAPPEASAMRSGTVPEARNDAAPPACGLEQCFPASAAAYERLTSKRVRPPKPEEARKDLAQLTRDCDEGALAVCDALGVVYIKGRGVEIDPTKARALFRRACDGGVAAGCYSMATLYRHGLGVGRNVPEAMRFLDKACGLGNYLACQDAAVTYGSGDGVPRDFRRSMLFFEKACDGGWSPACSNLARFYEYGAGVERNSEKAKAYYKKACELGAEKDCAHAKP
jgi:TPR repeat protein